MLIEHRGHSPSVHDSAYVAPTAVLCGDVEVGAGSRVLHGAVVTAEDGQVRIGRDVVIMENAVVKGRAGHPVTIGDFVLVGPNAHVNGAVVRPGAFIATGAALYPGSVIGSGAEIRINGVVQVNTTIEPGSVVPIGWVAVGTPASVHAPDQHRDIWAVQRDLDVPGTIYGVPPGTSMRTIMREQSAFYGAHTEDVVVGEAHVEEAHLVALTVDEPLGSQSSEADLWAQTVRSDSAQHEATDEPAASDHTRWDEHDTHDAHGAHDLHAEDAGRPDPSEDALAHAESDHTESDHTERPSGESHTGNIDGAYADEIENTH